MTTWLSDIKMTPSLCLAHTALYLLPIAGLWILCVVLYRRFFHPLAKVPGPFWWSISGLHILYYQVLREGQVMHELPKLHKIYGPVVRIGPNEIHLNDIENFHNIFNIGSKFLKEKSFFGPMEGPIKTPVILTAIEPDVHRARRGPLNPFFSRRSVVELEGLIWGKVRKLQGLIRETLYKSDIASNSRPVSSSGVPKAAKKPVFDMYGAIRAFSVDVVTEYSYARSWDHLDEEDFGAWYQESMRNLQIIFIWLQTFPFLIPVFGLIPDRMQMFILPFYKKWVQGLDAIKSTVKQVRGDISADIKAPRRTIFHELMDVQNQPLSANGKTREPLTDEAVFADAVNLTGAAAETTGATAERGLFEVIDNEEIYRKLTQELREAFPNQKDMTWAKLEKLPYLTGVVKEALRLNPGVPGRSPRTVPPGGATFNGITVPGGTIVSISASVLHQDEDIFPSPHVFDPTRWIGPEEEIRPREKSLVSFGKGSRNCLGQNLALCELYCSIGAIFYTFDDLELAPGFSRKDMDVVELLLGYHPRKAARFAVVRR